MLLSFVNSSPSSTKHELIFKNPNKKKPIRAILTSQNLEFKELFFCELKNFNERHWEDSVRQQGS